MRAQPLLAFILLTVASPNAPALPDELEVHLDDTTRKGTFAADVITNYTASGPRVPPGEGMRPTFHLLQISPDFSYGLTTSSQAGLQLFSSVGLGGNGRVDGGRIEYLAVPIRPEDEGEDGLFVGGLFEAGHLPATLSRNKLDGEIKLLAGYRVGRWTFATNPEVGFKLRGSGSSQPDLAVKLKAAYRVAQTCRIGIEHYGELGQLRHIGPLNQQSQQTFAVVDFKANGMDFNVGVGRGWNDFSEKWVLKAIASFPFAQ